MALSAKAVKSFIEKANEKVSFYRENPYARTICISKGNQKIGLVWNVSLLPIFSCGNCSHCSNICYDVKANIQYGNVLDARAYNYVFARDHMEEFFAAIDKFMSKKIKHKFFRWHVGGEILNKAYFAHMVEIARKHPDWKIWTYTKMYWIVNDYVRENGNDRHIAIPANFTIMFSKWDGMPMDNPYNFPVFVCKLAAGNKDTTEEEFASMFECPGNCDICKANNCGCIGGMNTFNKEH